MFFARELVKGPAFQLKSSLSSFCFSLLKLFTLLAGSNQPAEKSPSMFRFLSDVDEDPFMM